MMNPASSSSSGDDSSSVASSSGEEDARGRRPVHVAREPADSSDGDSDDDSGAGDDDRYGAREVTNFEDLPTDDSEDESDDDDESDSDEGDSESDGDGGDQEDAPLSERVASRALAGRRYHTSNSGDGDGDYDDGGKKKRAERKARAIELASERLREARRANKAKQQKSNDESDGSEESSVEQVSEERKRKKSKHAPTEMSSKRRDYFSRGRPDLNSSGIGVSIGANKYKARDPRMVSLSGHLDADVFEKRYGFLEEIQEKEIEQLQKRMSAWKQTGKKGQKKRKKLGITQSGSMEEDKEELTRLLQERAERKRANVVRAAKHAVKKKIKDDVASGKRGAYYPKRSELKRMEAEAKFEEIRKRGGDGAVEKAITKRRKKNMSKAAKQMPSHMIK